MTRRNSVTLSQPPFCSRAKDWPDPPTGYWASSCNEWDLFTHWERVLWNEYNQAHADGAVEWKNRARKFCDSLQSSEVIKELCEECPHPYTHAVIALLYDRRWSGDKSLPTLRALRQQLKQERRRWRATAAKFGKMQKQLTEIPADHLPDEERAALKALLEESRQQAARRAGKPPEGISIRLVNEDGEITEAAMTGPRRDAGKPHGYGARYNVFIALLVGFLEGSSGDAVESRRRALALLKDFEPEEFPATYSEEALRRRVEAFRGEPVHKAEIARTRTLFLKNVVNLRWPSPDFLNDSLRDRKDIPTA